MIQLKSKGKAQNISETIVAKIISEKDNSERLCFSPYLLENIQLTTYSNTIDFNKTKIVSGINSLINFKQDDIILISPNGVVYNLFRNESLDNSIFITERCNSNCLMCSQPPKDINDFDYHFEINTQLIKLIPPTTPVLGITGGEPTLIGDRFITILELITEYLPETEIHILSNGRLFSWNNLPLRISKINNLRFIFGIPLYSDFYQLHDYVVQVKGAFNQTIRGLHNMARFGLRIELRIVLHKQTFSRLFHLSKYIYKNLPFVEHIAFMGLEYTGNTTRNSDLLWIDPTNYANELEEAIFYLDEMGMNVSIYNLQLCLIKPTLWKFARNSISDWKKEFLNECNKCNLKNKCCGIFATSKKHSNEIKAISN